MVTSNKNLMIQAREALKGRWGLAVGTFFVYTLIMVALSGGYIAASFYPIPPDGLLFVGNSGYGVMLLVGGAFALGLATFSLTFARKVEVAKLEMIFSGFKHFGKALGLYFVVNIFILLWALLLIIPGIIASLAYSQVYYLMSDNPKIGIMEAINKSEKMMKGYKWKLFCLGLRFIGWIFLGILTLGIGFLWIMPYISISFAKFHDDVKANLVE